MSHLTEEDVKAILNPYHGTLRQLVCSAYEEFVFYKASRAERAKSPVRYPRTIANFVFDEIANLASSEFTLDKDVAIFEQPQTIKLLVQGQVIIRFKKGDSEGLGRNVMTQAEMDFIDPQQSLPGLPKEAEKVEITWKPNVLGTEISSVSVVSRSGSHSNWSYEIPEEESGRDFNIVPIPPHNPSNNPPLVSVKNPNKTASSE
ncbi:hypothetical protein [Cohaesibacter marisflavi]|uniref:hypothetical protein n=1 Tax=Cohaesibacter marisflavi TaxID=655353 RepID=UPI0029C875ED|nr:hypothetical protein [Cohaesibacter marisflavi]